MIRRSAPKVESKKASAKQRPAKRKRRMLMEGLEKRNLMAADLPINSGPNNIGEVSAVQVIEAEGLGDVGENDSVFTAEPLNLGTAAGNEPAIDVLGNLSFRTNPGSPFVTTDIDTYAVTLRQGDILDIAVSGSAGTINVFYGPEPGGVVNTGLNFGRSGELWFGTDSNNSGYPSASPLQTEGNAVIAQVVPETRTYYIQTTPVNTNSTYTLGLRTYRPVTESLPVGQTQKLFLDFSSQVVTSTEISGAPGTLVRLEDFYTTLANVDPSFANIDGTPRRDVIDTVIDNMIAEVQRHFDLVGDLGNNGDFSGTGTPGSFGIEIVDSRDPANFNVRFDPTALRINLAGTGDQIGVPGVFGFAQNIDVGNFELGEQVFFVLDAFLQDALTVPLSNTVSLADYFAVSLANTVAHEIAHAVGIYHTDNTNTLFSTIDAGGGNRPRRVGVGLDGIYGTFDDVPGAFRDDRFDLGEGIFGRNRVVNALANSLVSGTVGTGVSGRVFDDANGDGSGAGDAGLAGVTVFADTNGNGSFDPSEPSAITSATGAYSLSITPGTSSVIAVVPPTGFSATTPSSVTLAAGGSAPSFGFRQINPDITGTTFTDTNGNGVRDAGDLGIPDVFIYADLDGDNRPDLGEPSARSDANGNYSLDIASPGTFAIRQIISPGFEQTFPSDGEHVVTFDGTSLNGTFDFGLLPSQDFGDAPDSYGTTSSAGGASHGVTAALRLGSLLDREADGSPSDAADGDDNTGSDDEDGVRIVSPLAPGSTGVLEVDILNNTGSDAYLQGFIDFGGDGDFTDASDIVTTNLVVPSSDTLQTINVSVSVPSTANLGTTFARFRIAPATNIGPLGFAAGGEVEDYQFAISQTSNLANNDSFNDDDRFNIDRNSLSNVLPVLDNDFVTANNNLTIVQLQTLNVEPGLNTAGTVTISNGGKTVLYTPPNGFVGRDVFLYTVQDAFGNLATAKAEVSVAFQTNVPIAVDDIFPVTPGTSSRSLNVLDNDVESTIGGLRVTSVTAGDQGGQVSIIGGGQSVRYTPQPGFGGTEQFVYSIQDAAGSVSTATVTVNVTPGSEFDDLVQYSIELLSPDNTDTEITNLTVGQDVLVRVSVEDLSTIGNDRGVASGFIDLLYSSGLVSTLPGNGNGFPFDITFGSLFDANGNLLTGDDQVPGLINEVGGVQNIGNIVEFDGPAELFTVRLRASAPGVAVFAADPADLVESETILVQDDTIVPISRQGFGRAELTIFPGNEDFTSAIEDSFPAGLDSIGQPITSNLNQPVARLNVLSNDNLGPTGNIIDFTIINSPTLGSATINDNGTADVNDDFIEYRPSPLSVGLEQFRYSITTEDGFRSTANVTLSIGDPQFDVEYTFDLVDANGNPIDSVGVGQRFGIQMTAEQFINNQYVYAAFQDILYTADLISPSTTLVGGANYEFDFDVEIAQPYDEQAGTGTAARSGLIDEFGSFDESQDGGNINNPAVVATLFFEANQIGTATVVGSPADSFPEHQTLVLDIDDPIDPERIKYSQFQFQITANAAPQQNPAVAQDVNADGTVSPIDALLVINDLRRRQSAPQGESLGSSPSLYTDVSGDSKTTPIDALMVINYIRAQRNVVSGESLADSAVTSATGQLIAQSTSIVDITPISRNNDVAIAELDAVDSLVDTSSASPRTIVNSSALLDAISAIEDDSDDDIFDMLANDQIQS